MDRKFDQEEMKDDIVKWVSESRVYYTDRFTAVDEYVKRYEAKRSISGLMGWGDDPKKKPKDIPWSNSSDIGIPIEAFTIEGLLPRFLKVCYGATPIVWVKGNSDDDLAQVPTVQEALNFQLTKRIKIYRRMKNVFKNTVMCGDGIAKCVWEEETKIINRVAYYIQNEATGEFFGDDATGELIEVKKDTEIPPTAEDGTPQVKVKKILSEKKKVYDGPKIYSRNIKQVIIPKDACSPEIDELDWICDTYERTIDWCKRRVGDQDEGLFDDKAIKELEEDILVKNPATQKSNHNYSKVLISEWHGRYDVNDDGLDEEIVVFIGSANITGGIGKDEVKDSKLLGWMISPYPKRPFFHYQIIPMDNSFYGKGVPEFLIGIRNLIDAVFNQMIDRGSISNNPPIIVPPGHDPDENPFGPGQHWVEEQPGVYRVLELPKSEQLEFVKMEFLLGLVQKLFGVTDYSLGSESSIAKNRTASGIMTIVGEGNIKFDDMIRALQDVNEDLYDFIVQLNAEYLDDEFIFYLTGVKDNPFKKTAKKDWIGNFDFESAGNSININREIEQNRATMAYNTMLNSFGKNPVITAEVMRQLTENFFRSIDMRNIKIPTIEELQKMEVEKTAQAMQLLQQQQAEQLAKDGGKNGSPNPALATAGQPGQGIPGLV